MTSILIAVVAIALSASSAGALDVTICGEPVPDGETGVLQADLDCSGDPAEAAVTLGNGSTLDMNGHAIVARRVGVSCGSNFGFASCTVRGHGVAPSGVGDVSGGDSGIVGASRRVIVSDVNVHDVAVGGIGANQNLILTNVNVLRTGWSGIVSKKLTATNVVSNDNAQFGIDAERVRGTNITTTGNGYSGVTGRHCLVTGLVANNNGVSNIHVGAGGGVQATRVTLLNSTLTGNVVDGVLVDIDTYHHPHLASTTCDHSRQRKDPGRSWGVCQLD